jgi:hypothetical protein
MPDAEGADREQWNIQKCNPFGGSTTIFPSFGFVVLGSTSSNRRWHLDLASIDNTPIIIDGRDRLNCASSLQKLMDL